MDVLQMSVSAAVLIIAIVIFRAVTLYKLPKKTFLVLWGVVVCRLLIPFSIPSRFSLYTGIDMLRRTSTETMHLTTPITSGITEVETGISNNLSTFGIGGIADSGTPTIPISISPFIIIWLIGIGTCAIFFIVAYIRCRREFKTALPVEDDFITCWQQKHRMWLPVQIRQSDRIKAPLTYGVFRPVVLLPKALNSTNEPELQYILTHEYVHIRRFDALTKLLLTAALCIHWFNPFVWVMYILANRDIELSCDETVVRLFGEFMKSSYALTLIEFEERKSQLTPLCNNFSKNAIEERINAIMKIKKLSIPIIFLAVLLVGGITVGFATSSANAANANDNPDTQSNAEKLNDTSQTESQSVSTSAHDEKTTIEDLDWVWPCENHTVVSRYGTLYHPIEGTSEFSDHIIIAGEEGTAVYSALAGTVSEASFDDEQGNYIIISHDNGIETIYRHLNELKVSKGDVVAAGDTIGTVGLTGNTTGANLEFCVYVDGTADNPLSYISQ